jgi:hypothetical protein
VLQVALSYAKSQHEATRRAVDGWTCLRDGFVGSNIILSTQTRRVSRHHQARKAAADLLSDEPEVRATIYSSSPDELLSEARSIVAVDHELLKLPDSPHSAPSESGCVVEIMGTSPDAGLPLVVADPVPEGNDHALNSCTSDSFGLWKNASISQSFEFGACGSSHVPNLPKEGSIAHRYASAEIVHRDFSSSKSQDLEDNEAMTSSMQSLVNGLMTWGGEDVDVDFTLPVGMAASIAIEQSGVFGTNISYS